MECGEKQNKLRGLITNELIVIIMTQLPFIRPYYVSSILLII